MCSDPKCNESLFDHEQVPLNITIYVDKGIKDLIEQLWNHGLITQYSCENQKILPYGESGFAHIIFPDYCHGIAFAAFLESLEIEYKLQMRDTDNGNAANVRFPNKMINTILSELNSSSYNGESRDFLNYWIFQKTYRTMLNDYKERSKLDEAGWQTIKVFKPSKVFSISNFD